MANTDDELEDGGASLIERASAPHLAAISEKARDYARNARSDNTRRAYDADWRQFCAWLRRQRGSIPCPPTRKPSASISPPVWRELWVGGR